MTEPKGTKPDLVLTMFPRRLGSSPVVRLEMNCPSSVISTPENLGASPYRIRLRSLSIWAFLFSVERGIWYFLEISLRIEVMEAGTLGMCVRMRTWFLLIVLSTIRRRSSTCASDIGIGASLHHRGGNSTL